MWITTSRVLKKPVVQITILLFLFFSIWRVVVSLLPESMDGGISDQYFWWAATYQILALWGAFWGFVVSRHWGGFRSVMGRAILAFAFGLLLQSFGQTVYSVLIFQNLEIPYPSIGDIGFFGSIPFYIYGILMLAKASGVTVSLRAYANKIQAILIPVIMLAFSYFFFLRGYEFDMNNPLLTFLDFGYPLGQAIYVSIAIMAYLLSRNLLGGLMRGPTLFFLSSLVVQYLADYTFLYRVSRDLYVGGDIVDYMYLVAYTMMAISLVQLRVVYQQIREGSHTS